ncbi:hypothetical protein ACKF11_13420 [Methylobacillus sp. Pita2]|uniref:hypothetical protein n=1 Tax=Methylobacillus sp. Pita2 TaxID=3383245 RepID=UPI0038B4D303
MGLQDYRNKKAAGTGNNGGSPNLGNAAVKVLSVQNDDGIVKINAELLFDSIGRKAGEQIQVIYNPDTAIKITENLKRGMGTSKDSILILENVVNGKEEGVVVARWITTAVSATKAMDEATGHHLREVEAVMLQTPTIFFKNPTPAAGEPEYINFGLTTTQQYLPVKNGNNSRRIVFDRAWLTGKLGDALKRESQGDYPNVSLSALALAPHSSILVTSIDGAIGEVVEITNNPNMVALVRIRDENNDVATAQIRRRYQQDSDDLEKQLREGNLIRDIPNEALADELEAGNWKLEIVTGSDIPYLGDTRTKVLSEVANTPLENLHNHTITFGQESAGRVVDAIIVTMPTKDGTPCFTHEPLRLTGSQRSAISYLKTPNFDVAEPARQAATRSDDNAGPSDTADAGGAPEPGGESFSANGASEDDYHFDHASASQAQEAQQHQQQQSETPPAATARGRRLGS